jgi:hypothetical protein
MAQAIGQEVNLQLRPETNIWRRTYLPVGSDVSDLKSVGSFTDEELKVIAETPFLASRIRAAAEMPTPIGWNDTYKGKKVTRSFTDARQAYNFAVNNPTEFLKSEFPAYLGSGSPDAATQLVSKLAEAGETPENISTLYESALEEAPKYTESFEEYSARKAAERGSGAGGAFGWLVDYVVPLFTTAGAIAGGPIGAAVANSIAQLSTTGKVDPVQAATAAATAYVGQEVFGPAATEAGGVDYSLAGGGADVGGTGFQVPGGEFTGINLAPEVTSEGFKLAAESLAPGVGTSIVPVNLGMGAQDYSLLGGTSPDQLATIGETGLLPGTGGEGLQLPQVPALPGMGGGQGLVVPVEGGYVTETGFTPEGATPVLGDPDSFINDPEVLGRPVIEDVSEGFGPRDVLDTLRRARSVYNLLNPPASGQAVGGGLLDDTGFQPTGVEFPLAGVTQVQRAALPSLGPVISPYISKKRLSLLSQPSNLLGYQPNFSLLG